LGMGRAFLALGKPHAAATELELVTSFWRNFDSESHERYRQAAALHALAMQATRSRPMLART
jgi:hypothetical protein